MYGLKRGVIMTLSSVRVTKTIARCPERYFNMQCNRNSEERIIGILKAQEACAKVIDLALEHGMSEQSLCR